MPLVFRDSLHIATFIGVVYLFYFYFIPRKLTGWDGFLDELKHMRFALTHIAVGILTLRGIVWLFDHFHLTS